MDTRSGGASRNGGAPVGLPRLLSGLGADSGTVGLSAHVAHWGSPPRRSGRRSALIEEIERSGLRGRGGAGFPTAVKWRAVSVRRLRRAVVVANGAEAEPVSAKDQLLMQRVPHLVLDGASLAASAVGAGRVVIYVPPALVAHMSAAVAARQGFGLDPVDIEVVAAVVSFVAGEESAVVVHLNGGPGGLPAFTGLRPVYERGVGGAPTLVQNVETLAHAALIGRFGGDWFSQLGTSASPGTALLTLSGVVPPTVMEIALGTSLGSVLAGAQLHPASIGPVLMGGFGGSWVELNEALGVPVCEEGLRGLGATLGAGVVGLLPVSACPLAETAHIAAYMSSQGAGQCGPCTNGLPAIASAAAALAWNPRGYGDLVERIEGLGRQVSGRGACHHPDGVVRMALSALRVFSGHVDGHLRHGPCEAAAAPPTLKVPDARHRIGPAR